MMSFMKKDKGKDRVQETCMLGRSLLIIDPRSHDIRFLSRGEIPPQLPVHVVAQEPFTILDINPRLDCSDITEITRSKSISWLECLPDNDDYAREIKLIRDAASILGNTRSCIQYKAFAKQYYEERDRHTSKEKRDRHTRKGMHRSFFKAIIAAAPELKRRQTISEIKAGGIFATSLLVSLILLIVVLTIPVGGISISGYAFFASTLFAAWGPAAIIPILAIVGLGGLVAYWYKQHNEVFKELQGCLEQVMDHQMVAIAYAIDDYYMLEAFDLFKNSSSEYRMHKKEIEEERDTFMTECVENYVENFIECLASKITDNEDERKMTPEQFFIFLEKNPGEIRQCFQHSFSGIAAKNNIYGLPNYLVNTIS